ncbi:MAG: hypothetical protein Q9183_004470, partial [Haloplaca sp. 2 TL-2023]
HTPAMSAGTAKRKAIDDFFLPRERDSAASNPNPQQRKEPESSGKISVSETAVPGLSLYGNFISEAEEASLLAFLNDTEKCKWRTDLSRRTMHFGGTYCLLPSKKDHGSKPSQKPEIHQAPPIPPDFQWLIQRMVNHNIYKHNQRPQYCIVNEYTDTLGISTHTENFQFGEPVVGLSLGSACPIRFHELTEPFDGSVRSGKAATAMKTGRVEDVEMPARSLLVMKGLSRWNWQHEIRRTGKGRGPGWKRTSLTLRWKP